MDFEQLSFEAVQKILQSAVVPSAGAEKFHFLPDVIWERAEISGCNIYSEIIGNWEIHDFDEHDFLYLIRKNYAFEDSSRVIFIADECFVDKMAFVFLLEGYFDFVAYFEARFNMCFFQPSDYILIFPDEAKVVMIHHEGHLVYISKTNSYGRL